MKIKVAFAPEFFHRLKKLAPDLQEEAIEKVDLFPGARKELILG